MLAGATGSLRGAIIEVELTGRELRVRRFFMVAEAVELKIGPDVVEDGAGLDSVPDNGEVGL